MTDSEDAFDPRLASFVAPILADGNGLPPEWWGPIWARPNRTPVSDLVRDGVISAEAAALLWQVAEDGGSLVVAAGPSGAGKTTMLTAIADLLDARFRRVFLRGVHETFAFAAQADPDRTLVMVNEISPHLPIYTWGSAARRTLRLAREGCRVMATMHAESVEELVYQLSSYPLRIPIADIGALSLVTLLDYWEDGRGVHREIRAVAAVDAENEGRSLVVDVVAERSARSEGLRLDVDAAERLLRVRWRPAGDAVAAWRGKAEAIQARADADRGSAAPGDAR
ncbi:MAG: hypothetical protein ACR2OO_14740 [Thermomicrobiales bacterium]